jgi:hypothetical protein
MVQCHRSRDCYLAASTSNRHGMSCNGRPFNRCVYASMLLALFISRIRLACALAATKVADIASKRQRVWIQAIQKRVDATATMLGTMKSVKMLGLEPLLFKIITRLRADEINSSKGFRMSAVYAVGLCKFEPIKRCVTWH